MEPQYILLPSESMASWLWLVVLLAGAVVQLAGVCKHQRILLAVGTVFICCAACYDRDPVLAVGQLLITMAFWPRASEGSRGWSSKDNSGKRGSQ